MIPKLEYLPGNWNSPEETVLNMVEKWSAFYSTSGLDKELHVIRGAHVS